MYPVALLLAHRLSMISLSQTQMARFEAVMAAIPTTPTMPKLLQTQLFQYPLPSNRLFPQYDQRGCFGVPGTLFFFCPVRQRRIANLLQRHPRCADSEHVFFRWDTCRFARKLLFILWRIMSPWIIAWMLECVNAWVKNTQTIKQSDNQAIEAGVAYLSPPFLCAPSGLEVASFLILSFFDMFPLFFPFWNGEKRENDRITIE